MSSKLMTTKYVREEVKEAISKIKASPELDLVQDELENLSSAINALYCTINAIVDTVPDDYDHIQSYEMALLNTCSEIVSNVSGYKAEIKDEA